MTMLRSFLAAVLLCLGASAAQAVPSITVAPGSSPAGYIPLDSFGVTPIAIGDEDALNFNTPNYVYAGQTWNRIGVTSNGYAVVGGTSGPADITFLNTDLPEPSAPKNILAPLWTDLDGTGAPGILATILTDGVNDWIVIEWRLNAFGTADLNSFQVWIGANGVEDITFTYGALDLPAFVLSNLTVGANDISGTVGDAYYYNGAGTLPAVGTDLRVTTRDLPVQVAVPEPATLALLGAGLLGVIAVRKRRVG